LQTDGKVFGIAIAEPRAEHDRMLVQSQKRFDLDKLRFAQRLQCSQKEFKSVSQLHPKHSARRKWGNDLGFLVAKRELLDQEICPTR
jgi:hypothetical protein